MAWLGSRNSKSSSAANSVNQVPSRKLCWGYTGFVGNIASRRTRAVRLFRLRYESRMEHSSYGVPEGIVTKVNKAGARVGGGGGGGKQTYKLKAQNYNNKSIIV